MTVFFKLMNPFAPEPSITNCVVTSLLFLGTSSVNKCQGQLKILIKVRVYFPAALPNPSNPMILKVFLKKFPFKMKASIKCSAKENKGGNKTKEEGWRKATFYFFCMPNFRS